MASIANLVEGLEIIAKTASQGRRATIWQAVGDIIWAPECSPSTEDAERLKELGWYVCSRTGLWVIDI